MHRLFLNILFECNLTPDTDTYRSPCVLLYILCLSDFLSVHQGLKVLFVSTRLLHVREGKKKRKLTFQLMIFPPFERLESNSLWTAPTQAQLFHCSRCPFSNCAHKGKMPRLLFFFFLSLFNEYPPAFPEVVQKAVSETFGVLNDQTLEYFLSLSEFHDQLAEV